MVKKGRLQQAAIAFSLKLIHLYDRIERKAYLKNQLARSGTSIGANIHEAVYGESSDDFVHKMSIALKECNETEYWLTLLATAVPELAGESEALKQEAGSIRRMLIATINTVKDNKNK
ncbi:MAG: four helix bundle protein [Akkermansia sp.]|nr:four helix bundle protein [Akkermansia sp.]